MQLTYRGNYVYVQPDNSILKEPLLISDYEKFLPKSRNELPLAYLTLAEVKAERAKRYYNRDGFVFWEKDKHFYIAYKNCLPGRSHKELWNQCRKQNGLYYSVEYYNRGSGRTERKSFVSKLEALDFENSLLLRKAGPVTVTEKRVVDPALVKCVFRLPFRPLCMSKYDIAFEWVQTLVKETHISWDISDLMKVLEAWEQYIVDKN